MQEPPALFDDQAQKILIKAVRSTEEHLDVVIRLVATDQSHIHVLLQWTHARPWDKLRASIKTKLSKVLKEQIKDRTWLSEGASRKHVKDYEHLQYLETQYLPDHLGWKWCFKRGWFK